MKKHLKGGNVMKQETSANVAFHRAEANTGLANFISSASDLPIDFGNNEVVYCFPDQTIVIIAD